MPAWVKDHDTWERAKAAAKKTYSESDDGFWGAVTEIYKKMGGGIQHAAKSVPGGLRLIFRRKT